MQEERAGAGESGEGLATGPPASCRPGGHGAARWYWPCGTEFDSVT